MTEQVKTEQMTADQAISKAEGETVMLEELSIRTYQQGGRLHRTFGYHISHPLPKPKPVEEEKPEKKIVEEEKPESETDGDYERTFNVCITERKRKI
jgi:hypothetical protein